MSEPNQNPYTGIFIQQLEQHRRPLGVVPLNVV